MKAVFLGCAHMHSWSYVSALKRKGVEVLGVIEKEEAIAKRFSEEHNVPYFDNLAAILDTKPDVAVVCSDNFGHLEFTLAAAERGIHVIVEKPIGISIEAGQTMIDACKKNNVKLFVCFPVRYERAIVTAKKALEEGAIGDIVSIVATNHGSMPGGWFVDKARSGGGAVIDHTVHVADIMNWIMGSKVVDVKAVMDNLIHPIPTEDCGLLLIEFENGCIASIDTSWNRPKTFPCWGDVVMDFIGTKGSLRVDAYLDHAMLYSDVAGKPTFITPDSDSDYEMISDFIDSIEKDLPVPVSGEDGLFATDIALRAYKFNGIN